MNNAPKEKYKQYCAFLRGINVGGHTTVKMEELRKAFASLGFLSVRTVLASGNVLFEAPQDSPELLSRKISGGLREALGREVVVVVRSLDELRKLEARKPFRGIKITPLTRLFVTFLSDNTVRRDIKGQLTYGDFRILSVSGGAICSVLDERPGVGAVRLMGAIEKEYGPMLTTRTWNTITRILKTGDTG